MLSSHKQTSHHSSHLWDTVPLCTGPPYMRTIWSLFISLVASDLTLMKSILSCFEGASGLATNLSKCHITPIRCSEDLELALSNFPCAVAEFPCRYLDSGRPWSALSDSLDPDLVALFAASVTVQVGNGRSGLFWKDRWINGQSIESLAPNLFLLIPKRTLLE
uniref:Uncharacterized protein n=1 Tax=Arundo donax TaxID=35708 RepID=A0A0A9CG90_ARUDO